MLGVCAKSGARGRCHGQCTQAPALHKWQCPGSAQDDEFNQTAHDIRGNLVNLHIGNMAGLQACLDVHQLAGQVRRCSVATGGAWDPSGAFPNGMDEIGNRLVGHIQSDAQNVEAPLDLADGIELFDEVDAAVGIEHQGDQRAQANM